MSRQIALVPLLMAAALIAASPTPSAFRHLEASARVRADDDKPDYAPILERMLDFHSFNFPTIDGHPFDLRDYAQGKQLVIIEFLAGWCRNSNRNGHILERLWTRYREHGLGVVGVAEYSDDSDLRIHINRIGIDYPVVVETRKLDQRTNSSHYKYRRAVGDKRRWGTPFYVIVDSNDIVAAVDGPFSRHVYTVSGELMEDEANRFIQEHLADTKPK